MSDKQRRIPNCRVKPLIVGVIFLAFMGILVVSAYAKPEPRAVIVPLSPSYHYTNPPSFEILTGSNEYYKVELALAKHLFESSYGNRITSTTDARQNFYASSVYRSKEGEATFTVPSNVWSNLRGSRVFYRVITSSKPDGGDIRYSTKDGDWESAPHITRIGETWYGLPLNDRTKIGNLDVVVNGLLNGRAMSSDYGPRNVTGGSRFHPGIDIPVAKGTPLYAVANGTIVIVPTENDQMHRLDIDHGDHRSGYVHLDEALVSMNEQVMTGQLIGYSGDWYMGEPDNIADHLHFDCGYDGGQIFHNPLEYLRHTDDHTVSSDATTFLKDSYTHNHPLDVVQAAGDQSKLLVAFGVTTSFDKDLNYVRIQMNNSVEDGQYFELDYDQVVGQNSNNGVVTLSNGKTFRVRPLTDEIYRDTNLAYAFYVKPANTNINIVAKDYFYFPWDVSHLTNQDDGGPHTIRVTLREVDGNETTLSRQIGPQVLAGSPRIVGNQVMYDLTVFNHDYQAGEIGLQVKNLPVNWTASFSNDLPLILADKSVKITLTLTAPGPASMTPLFQSKTKVVATSLRLPILKDAVILCPGEVWIDQPIDGAKVEVGQTVLVVVKASEDAKDVILKVNGIDQPFESFDKPNTWNFLWPVPSDPNKQYKLQAFAMVKGIEIQSEIVNVTSFSPITKIAVILSPDDGAEVEAGETTRVEVNTDPAATKVNLKIDGFSNEMVSSDGLTWNFDWQVPSGIEKEYRLQAFATIQGETVESSPITVQAVDKTPDPYELEFMEPQDGATLPIGQKITVRVYAPDTTNVDVDSVSLDISPADQDGGGQMTNAGSGVWTYDWTPQPGGGIENQTYTLIASAYNTDLEKVGEELIQVFAEGVNPVDPWIEGPSLVLVGAQARYTAKAPQANRITLKLNTNLVCDEFASECIFIWNPRYEGKYTLLAVAYYEGGVTKSDSMEVEVKKAPAMSITSINEYAFLGKLEGLDLDAPLHNGTYIPLPISSSDYACGVVGYNARGGDIGEHVDYFYTWVPDAIGVFLKTDWGGTYQLVADINTIHWARLIGDYDEDRPEIWDVTILCVSTEVASVQRLSGLGDNVNRDTGLSISDNICGIGGFWAHGGDIQEHDDGDIIRMYLYRQSGNWHLRADFRTHNGRKGGNENWDVNLLCLDPEFASLDAPVPDKPFFIREYRDLGDNVGSKRIVDTGYSVDDYVCGVTGFAARDGDIDEGNYEGKNTNLLLAYMYSRNGTWHIRADFRTHKDNESWDVNILCARRDNAAPPKWNVSHEETGVENCMGDGYTCQVLTNDSINLTGSVILKGGGYSGSPTRTGYRCNSLSEIEVYINDHDPGTGKPLWSWPDMCIRDGVNIYIQPGYTYDFRTASFTGATPKQFKLVDPDAPLVLLNAEPKIYDGEYEAGKRWGPGMALTWEPTLHPQAAYYEIQFSEDLGNTWQVYTNRREIHHGGWINHHGDLACGHNFYRCLKRVQDYSYRVRVLNGSQNPLTDWSNVITRTSLDWPAHVELSEPVPQGPYPHNTWTEIELSVENTYGEGLQLEWTFKQRTGAEYQVVQGCKSGSLGDWDATHCILRVRHDTTASIPPSSKLAALEPAPGVEVIVSALDRFGYSDWKKITLGFRTRDDPDKTAIE